MRCPGADHAFILALLLTLGLAAPGAARFAGAPPDPAHGAQGVMLIRGEYVHIYRVYHGVIERDLRFHDIRRSKGLYYLMRENGFVDPWGGSSFDHKVEQALLQPPSNTRARVRGKFIRWMNDNNFDGGARWDSVYIYGKQLKKIDLPSPFKSSYRKVAELMKNYTG